MEALSVPFIHHAWTDKYDGAITVHGVLRTEPGGLALEWRSEENYYGVKPKRESAIRTVTIPWKDLQSIEYRRKFIFWGVLVLRTRSLRALDGVPGARGSEVALTIAVGDRTDARGLAAEVGLEMVGRRWDELGESDAPPALPPA
jgi:hypothetical protein